MKKITSLMLALLMMLSFVVTASAAEMGAKGGLQVAISTDADAYFEAEPINVTVKVKNNNDYAMKNVAVETILPDGLYVEKGEATNAKFNLAAGEMKTVSLTAYAERIPDLPSYDKPEKGDKGHKDNKEPTKSNFGDLEGEGCLPTDACGDPCLPTEESDKKEEGKCKGDGTCADDCYCKQPDTGDGFNAFLWVAVLMFAVAAGAFVLKGNKKAIKALCIMFCLLVALAVIPVDTLAASDSIVVDRTVQVGYYDYVIKAKVSFDLGGKAPVQTTAAPALEDAIVEEDTGDMTFPVDGPAPTEATTSVLEAGFDALSGALSGLAEDGTIDKLVEMFK